MINKFFKYLMPFVFLWSFVQSAMDDNWIAAFWVAIAAGWYTLYTVTMWLHEEQIRNA